MSTLIVSASTTSTTWVSMRSNSGVGALVGIGVLIGREVGVNAGVGVTVDVGVEGSNECP
jgi:hypothetical protein